jgi:hypothetical protein
MSSMEWTSERRAQAAKVSRLLRKDGYSYEEIVNLTATPGGETQMQPWEVYEFCNPGKSPAQVQAWKARHYPDA